MLDPNNPWIVALGVFVTLGSLDSLLGTRLIARGVMWMWHTNVADPISRMTTRRSQIQREQIRAEVLVDLKAHVMEAIRETVQKPNGGSSIPDVMSELAEIRGQLLGQLEQQDEKLSRLYEYSHDNNHELRQLMTPLVGKVGMLWRDYVVAHRLDEGNEEP